MVDRVEGKILHESAMNYIISRAKRRNQGKNECMYAPTMQREIVTYARRQQYANRVVCYVVQPVA